MLNRRVGTLGNLGSAVFRPIADVIDGSGWAAITHHEDIELMLAILANLVHDLERYKLRVTRGWSP